MKRVPIVVATIFLLGGSTGCSDDSDLQRIAASKTAANNEAKQPASTGNAAQDRATERWYRYRGLNGAAHSNIKGLPTEWSATKNLAWKTQLPGPGASCPIVVNNRIYVTCYSGYGVDKNNPGDPKNLKRHIRCINGETGKVIWDKTYVKDRNISHYRGFMQLHGYASSTPVSDGERIYVYFGTWGAAAYDLKGERLWTADCGDRVHGFGSGASPIVHGDLVIVNASVESQSLFAFDKRTGKEVWRTKGIRDSWNTPILVESGGKTQIVLTTQPAIMAFDVSSGDLLWQYNGAERNTYVCPSLVEHDGVIYGMPGYHGPLAAVRANGKEFWKSGARFRATVPSPVYYKDHIYYVDDGGNQIACFDARTGDMKKLLSKRLGSGVYSSPFVAHDKLYIVTHKNGTYVFSATPELRQIAHNTIAGDDSRYNASPVPMGRRLLLRSDKYLYCVGE